MESIFHFLVPRIIRKNKFLVKYILDLCEVDDHHGGPGDTDALGDGAAHRHQPAGPAGHHLPHPGHEVQPGVLTGEAGGAGRQGGEVEEDQYEEERGRQGGAQHVVLYVSLQQ